MESSGDNRIAQRDIHRNNTIQEEEEEEDQEGLKDRKDLLSTMIRDADDHHQFLQMLKGRMDRVSLDLPTIEVRFENLNVDAEAYVGSRGLPTIINSFLNVIEGVSNYLHILPNQKKRFSILHNISGIIKPGRMTLLLGPPGSGKTTLLLALSGKLSTELRVKTSVFLRRIGILDESATTLCILGKADQESVEHVLIFCPMIWRVWTGLLKWWGAQWMVPGSAEGLLQWWAGDCFPKVERRIWNTIPLVALWSTWKHRNECLFDDIQPVILQWWAGNCFTKAERRIWNTIPLVALWSIWKHMNECLFDDIQPMMKELQEIIIIGLAIWLKTSSMDFQYSINDFLYNIVKIRNRIGGSM